jgi:cell wall integrity and stress response component
MSLRFIALTGLLALTNVVRATTTEVAAEDPVKGTDTVHGCYGNVDNLTLNSTNEFNTQGLCSTACRGMSKAVGAAYSSDCYCGDEYPPLNTLLDDSECTEPCPGYDTQACGGINAWTVYNTGEKVSVASADNITESSSSSSASSTTSQAVMTSAGMFKVVVG